MTSEDGFPKLSAPARSAYLQVPATRASSSWLRSPSPTSRSSTAWDRPQYPLYGPHSTTEVARSAGNTGTGTKQAPALTTPRACKAHLTARASRGRQGRVRARPTTNVPRVGAEPVPRANRGTGSLPLRCRPASARPRVRAGRLLGGRGRTGVVAKGVTRPGGADRPLLPSGFQVVGWTARKSDPADRLIVSVPVDDARRGPVGGTVRTTVNWDLRHRESSLVIRLLLAVWITAVVVVLCATGRWWGLVFVVPLVLDLYLLRRILTAGSGG